MRSSKHAGFAAALMVVAALVVAPACRPTAVAETPDTGDEAASAALRPVQLQLSSTLDASTEANFAPTFTLTDLDGAQVRLEDSAGKIRLIDFWATWCAPCREEIPMLTELYETYREQGLTILAISDENTAVIRKFVTAHEIPYPNLVGNDELSLQYGVYGLPKAVLVDGEGRIVESFMGPKPRKILEAKIRELLELEPQT